MLFPSFQLGGKYSARKNRGRLEAPAAARLALPAT
jgi:hypothetical protein